MSRPHIRLIYIILLVCGLVVIPTVAFAQSTPGPWTFLLNGHVRATAPSFDDRIDPLIMFERSVIDVTYRPTTDLGGAAGLARRLTTHFGVTTLVSISGAGAKATAIGSLPHPLYFDRPRSVEGVHEVSGSHVALDLLATGFWQKGTHWTILAGAGPSVVRVNQAVVAGVNVIDVYPHDEVTVRGLRSSTQSGTGVGATALIDVTRAVSRRAGIAAFAQYTLGSVTTGAGDDTVTISLSGLRTGLGLRIRW
jgi:hypothetical protein